MVNITPVARRYATWRLKRLARQDPAETQRAVLRRLVSHARDTRFGRDHDFARIADVEEFQARVPLRRYDDFWKEYWQDTFPHLTNLTWPGTIPFFAESSGTTTGRNKYVPVSREMVRQYSWSGLDILVFHLGYRPQSRVMGGKSFMLGGRTALRQLAPGIETGFISGIAAKAAHRWASWLYFPPAALADIPNWEDRIRILAERSLREDIRTLGGMTSWLLLFIEELGRNRPDASGRLVDYYPNLELLVHGGVSFAPYRDLFEHLLDNSRAELREVYPASEGFIAIQDRGIDDGLRLLLDAGLFFELVPVEELDAPEPRRHWIGNAETGVNYALVLSSCAGLWSYVIGDTVRLVERDPPRLVITGRTAYYLSAFGERVIAEELETAVARAAAAIGRHVHDYSAGALYPDSPGQRGGHLFVIELADGIPSEAELTQFAETLDRALSELNADYSTHRAADYGMARPRVLAAPPGTFAKWMAGRGMLGEQYKVPRVINDQKLLHSLRELAESERIAAGSA